MFWLDQNMQPASDLLRALLGVMAGLALMGLMPVYDEPFVGCQARGFATLMLGCSLWPDFLVGLVTVLVVTLIGPRRFRPHLWGLAFVTIVAVLGGPAAIKSGMHLNLLRPADMMFYWSGPGLALLFGGLLGSGIAVCLSRLLTATRRGGGGAAG
jgi:hypothetical protein